MPNALYGDVPGGTAKPAFATIVAKPPPSSVYGFPARGFGTPACGGNPETIDSVAFPKGFCVDDTPPPAAARDPPPPAAGAPTAFEATIVATVPPPEGIAFAGVSTARLQLCSIGAKVKLSLLS